MKTQHKKHIISERLREELIRWRPKIDNAILKMNTGEGEVQEQIRPHVKKLELELFRAKEKWQKLYTVSDKEWKDIQTGLKATFKTIEKVYAQTERLFVKQ